MNTDTSLELEVNPEVKVFEEWFNFHGNIYAFGRTNNTYFYEITTPHRRRKVELLLDYDIPRIMVSRQTRQETGEYLPDSFTIYLDGGPMKIETILGIYGDSMEDEMNVVLADEAVTRDGITPEEFDCVSSVIKGMYRNYKWDCPFLKEFSEIMDKFHFKEELNKWGLFY